MYILHVNIRVKPESADAFAAATLINAEASRRESGVVRFDVLRDLEDPTRFALIEVYRNQAGHASHRETAHYATWRDTVTAMMAEPRTAKKYVNLSPDDSGWQV